MSSVSSQRIGLVLILASLALFFGFTLADSIIVVNKDNTPRTICFTPGCKTPNPSSPFECITYYDSLPTFPLAGCSQHRTYMPESPWSGTIKTVLKGQSCDMPKVIAEVTFNGWGGYTWYDISSIDALDDNTGARQMYMLDGSGTLSGCETFPCDNAYQLADDIQTRSSSSSRDVVVTAGDYSC